MALTKILEGYLPKDNKLISTSNWKGQSEILKFILTSKDIKKYIEAGCKAYTKLNIDYDTWKVGNVKTCTVIKLNFFTELTMLIKGLTNANDIQERLESTIKVIAPTYTTSTTMLSQASRTKTQIEFLRVYCQQQDPQLSRSLGIPNFKVH